jgi:hypothetical protein
MFYTSNVPSCSYHSLNAKANEAEQKYGMTLVIENDFLPTLLYIFFHLFFLFYETGTQRPTIIVRESLKRREDRGTPLT